MMAVIMIGPGLFDLIYTLAYRVPMTVGMHVARLGIADTEDLGSQPTRLQLLVRWFVKMGRTSGAAARKLGGRVHLGAVRAHPARPARNGEPYHHLPAADLG